MNQNPRKIVVGISGGSGAVLAIRLLEILKTKSDSKNAKRTIERHVIVTPSAYINVRVETHYSPKYIETLATRIYGFGDLAAPCTLPSFEFESMVVIPSSMHTLGALAIGISNNLLLRMGEIALQRKRKLVIMPREVPLTGIDIKNMIKLAEAGAVIMPPIAAFRERPKTVDDIVNGMTNDVLRILL